MIINRIYTSSKTYIILLVLAVLLLIFTAMMAYRQILRLQYSAEMVEHTHKVKDAVGVFFSHNFKLESSQFKYSLLNDNDANRNLNRFVAEGNLLLNDLKLLTKDNAHHQERLLRIESLKNNLYIFLEQSTGQPSSLTNALISDELFKIRSLTDAIRSDENKLLKKRQETYASQKFLAPATSLIMGLFALMVFLLAFIKIYRNKILLRKSETFLASVIQNNDNIINYYEPIYDDNGAIQDLRIIFANKRNLDYLGLDPAEIIGKNVSKVFPFLKLNGEFQDLVSCYTEGKEVKFDRKLAMNGRTMWFKSTITPHDTGLLITARNATVEEEAKAQQLILKDMALEDNKKLRETELFLSSILAHTDNVISYFTPHYNPENDIVDFLIVFNNENIENVLNEKVSDIENKMMSEILPMHFTNGVFELLKNCYEHGASEKFEKYYNFNDQVFCFTTTAVKLNGGILTSSTDITSQKQHAESLRAKNEELSRINAELEAFNRVASHDLQEPMRKIQMFISRITESSTDLFPQRTLEYFQKIENAAQRMQSLIVNLLTYSRIEGKHEDFIVVSLETILAKVKDDLSTRIDESNALISYDELPKVKGVIYQLEQLMSNLLSNAIKYRSQERPLKIKISSDKIHKNKIEQDFYKSANYYYKIVVSDNGIGFSKNHATKIFEVFTRLHQKTEYTGNGIGLAICKKIIENHHGYIYAKPNGTGSDFIFFLPI